MCESTLFFIADWIKFSGWGMNNLPQAATAAWNELHPEHIVRSFRHVIKRARKCIDFNGGRFEGETNPMPNEE